jgi:hypothetical protein
VVVVDHLFKVADAHGGAAHVVHSTTFVGVTVGRVGITATRG